MFSKTFFFVFCIASLVNCHELCRDGTNPSPQTLAFCTEYSGSSCCSVQRDTQIQQQYNNLGTLTTGCGNFLKKTLCSECDPWATHLIGDLSVQRTVPWYCPGYCVNVYTNCSTNTLNTVASPFNGVTQIATQWPTSTSFCSAWANDAQLSLNGGYCYNGVPYVPAARPIFNSNQGLCLTKVVAQAGELNQFISMNVPNDNTKRLFLGGRNGVIRVFQITNDNSPFPFLGNFLDLSNKADIVGEGGLLAFVFHPNYATNGRFFVSYTCDPNEHVECKWSCTVNSNCLYGGTCAGGFCTDHVLMSVVAEYSVSANPNVANPTEVKRIIQASQPGPNHNGGQILFGPDGYLYIFFGDGGGYAAAASQNLLYWMGKILRVNVDTGNNNGYTVPQDNPYVGTSNKPEIWASGMRNPWRNSFDFSTGSLWNGDVGQDNIEEVNLITKGGNYGWRKYEGFTNRITADIPFAYTGPASFYTHQDRTGACIIGGYVYRGTKDTCNYGRYVFADTEGEFFASFAAPSSDFFWSELSWKCGSNAGATLTCATDTITRVFSFGEDQDKNLYVLGGSGIFQVVEQWRCPTLVCNGTVANLVTTGQVASVTTGRNAQSVTTGATCQPAGTTVSCTSNRLALRRDCLDLVCSSPQTFNNQASRIAVIPSSNGTRNTNAPPPQTSRYLNFTVQKLSGTFIQGGQTVLSLWVDSLNVAQQAVGMQVSYDFTGDGSWDRVESYGTFPPNPDIDYEQITYDGGNLRSQTGNFQNLVGGTISFQVWSAFATCCPIYMRTDQAFVDNIDNQLSYIQIPYSGITWLPRAGTTPCGFGGSSSTACAGSTSTSSPGSSSSSSSSSSSGNEDSTGCGHFIVWNVLLFFFSLFM